MNSEMETTGGILGAMGATWIGRSLFGLFGRVSALEVKQIAAEARNAEDREKLSKVCDTVTSEIPKITQSLCRLEGRSDCDG